MPRNITRRDFINATLVGTGTSLLGINAPWEETENHLRLKRFYSDMAGLPLASQSCKACNTGVQRQMREPGL